MDATQTAVFPKWWVGDNVLAHLEEVAYLEETQQQRTLLFMDFEKAFDRLDRAWVERCMSAVGLWIGPAMIGAHPARGHIYPGSLEWLGDRSFTVES